ncbi:hypothetical protein Bbelb_051860 [Branchiostoma belcheri]|nr:hypothetical protein Bbelb_051860 [Branchiostoma belcheri]
MAGERKSPAAVCGGSGGSSLTLMDSKVILNVMHFNENANRAQGKRRDGEDMCTLHYPKYKKGGFIVRKVLEKGTFGCIQALRVKVRVRVNFELCVPTVVWIAKSLLKPREVALCEFTARIAAPGKKNSSKVAGGDSRANLRERSDEIV